MSGPPAVRRLADWSRASLEHLADDYETPVYVIDLDRVRENLERLQAAFPDTDIHYAAKANAGSAVLETVAGAGAGVECASAGEVTRALAAGFQPESVLYTPVNPPARDLEMVVDRWRDSGGLTITVGAHDTIDRLADRGYDGRVAVRVHPGMGAGHGESVATGADAKFGIPVDTVPDAVDAAEAAGMDVVGLHAHVGSGVLNEDIDTHRSVVETLADVARTVETDLEFVDVGGGFGVPYHPDEEPLDLGRIAEATDEALAGLAVRTVVEPGRFLVADAGVLLTRVNTIKDAGSGLLAGVDAGMTDLLRPAMYDAYHEIRNLAEDAARRDERRVSVVGPICESTDSFAEDRPLRRPERGDLLAIGNAGAYGIEMASTYNTRPRPPVVALEDGTDRLVRRRETVDDITEMEIHKEKEE
jgi:diaminopimelate decarboxylase